MQVFVETGTYLGDTIEAVRQHFDKIYSIELSRELFLKAKHRFKKHKYIKLIQGDSGVELAKVMKKIDQPVLFWLDGHYFPFSAASARGVKDTPIFEELACIFDAPDLDHIIIIDDVRCFGTEPGYPNLEDVLDYIRSRRQNVRISIEGDSIRVIPEHYSVKSSACG